jgi:hypothetical protein
MKPLHEIRTSEIRGNRLTVLVFGDALQVRISLMMNPTQPGRLAGRRSGEPSSCGRASCAFFDDFAARRRRTMHDDSHDRE